MSSTTDIPRYRLSLVCESESPWNEPRAVRSSTDLAKLFCELIGSAPQEVMAAIYLDTRSTVIGTVELFRGSANRITVDPRVVLQPALMMNAVQFVLAHNHPSGDLRPSAEDVAFTRRMIDSAQVMGIRMIDHIVVNAKGDWCRISY